MSDLLIQKLELPYPPIETSPNWRGHYFARARAIKNYRLDCFYLAKHSGIVIDWNGPIYAIVKFIPDSNRKRDDDNMIARFKPGRDGIANALGVDDFRFSTLPIIGEPEKTALVRMSISSKPIWSVNNGAE